jgi:hypothetical protein
MIQLTKQYFALLFIMAGISYCQNPQFLENKIFYADSYFFDVESLTKIKSLSGTSVNYGQNDSVVFTGNGNNLFSWNKNTLEQNPVFDTALFYNLSPAGYSRIWNVVYTGTKRFELDVKENKVKVYDHNGNYLKDLNDKESGYKRNINGRDFLIKSNNGFVHVKDLESEYGYIISGYDSDGNKIYKIKTEHTHIEIKNNTHHHNRYLNYFEHNSKYIIFSTNVFFREFAKTLILDLAQGTLTEIPVSVDGVLFDKNDNITGTFQYNQKSNEITFYDKTSDEVLWKYKYTDNIVYASNVTPLACGDKLILALYHRISTGSDLIALDLKTGKFIWHANVDQVNASHSEYYNQVFLYSYKDKVLMEGIESYGKYLQVFDVNTGSKLYSDIFGK